jgi:hypothetical protein
VTLKAWDTVKIVALWGVAPCNLVNLLPVHTAQHCKWQLSSYSPPSEPDVSPSNTLLENYNEVSLDYWHRNKIRQVTISDLGPVRTSCNWKWSRIVAGCSRMDVQAYRTRHRVLSVDLIQPAQQWCTNTRTALKAAWAFKDGAGPWANLG